jgi:type I restriction enzyme R subunit
MQRIISAEKSDIYDVLAYVAFASAVVTRETRAEQADKRVQPRLNDRQQDFVAFDLDHYVKEGVDQLDVEKLAPLLKLKYGSVEDAKLKLGPTTEIRRVFIEFQRHLYEKFRAA